MNFDPTTEVRQRTGKPKAHIRTAGVFARAKAKASLVRTLRARGEPGLMPNGVVAFAWMGSGHTTLKSSVDLTEGSEFEALVGHDPVHRNMIQYLAPFPVHLDVISSLKMVGAVRFELTTF
ncbi:MAG: hypothetical protein ACLQVY_15785 [Limisphaerales bacterium]